MINYPLIDFQSGLPVGSATVWIMHLVAPVVVIFQVPDAAHHVT